MYLFFCHCSSLAVLKINASICPPFFASSPLNLISIYKVFLLVTLPLGGILREIWTNYVVVMNYKLFPQDHRIMQWYGLGWKKP